MIISRIMGGLGNQMFQYALGMRTALGHNVEHKLDLTWFEHCDDHEFALGKLSTEIRIATDAEIDFVAHGGPGPWGACTRVIDKLKPRHKRHVVREHGMAFDPRVLHAPKHCCLRGYWQSERYFRDHAERLRDEFKPTDKLSEESAVFAERIKDSTAVSLHVRRGDYVSNPTAAALHGVPLDEYYASAVAELARRVSDPTYFIFSDDPGWVRDNMQLEGEVVVVDCNDASRNEEDMALMALCNHNIIANSSFSWWGAWLNPHENKIVTAPARWFLTDERDTSDLVPESWLRF